MFHLLLIYVLAYLWVPAGFELPTSFRSVCYPRTAGPLITSPPRLYTPANKSSKTEKAIKNEVQISCHLGRICVLAYILLCLLPAAWGYHCCRRYRLQPGPRLFGYPECLRPHRRLLLTSRPRPLGHHRALSTAVLVQHPIVDTVNIKPPIHVKREWHCCLQCLI